MTRTVHETTLLFCRKNLKKDMMLYVSFCKQIESDWMSLKQISEVCCNRYVCLFCMKFLVNLEHHLLIRASNVVIDSEHVHVTVVCEMMLLEKNKLI